MKNKILRIITLVMAILFIVASCVEPNIISVIVLIVSLGWWLLFMLANNDLTMEQLLGKWGRD